MTFIKRIKQHFIRKAWEKETFDFGQFVEIGKESDFIDGKIECDCFREIIQKDGTHIVKTDKMVMASEDFWKKFVQV